MISRTSVSEFSNERSGNIVHWRIVFNDYRHKHDWPAYFVYRVVEGPGGRPISEYLHRDGQVDGACGTEGSFEDYAQIGMAFILNQGREKAAGYDGFYAKSHRNWLESRNSSTPNEGGRDGEEEA